MKFKAFGEDLKKAVSEVVKVTPIVGPDANEIAISCDDDGISVWRNNGYAKALSVVDGVVITSGEVVLPDVSVLEFYTGSDIEFSYDSEEMEKIVLNSDELAVSSTSPNAFSRPVDMSDFNLRPVDKAVRGALWVYEKDNLPAYISGNAVFCHLGAGTAYASWYVSDTQLADEPCVIENGALKYITANSKILLTENKLYLARDNFRAEISTSMSPWQGEMFLDKAMSFETSAKCEVVVSDMVAALRYAKAMSVSQSFPQGLADIELTGDRLVVSSAYFGLGEGSRDVSVKEATGEFKVRCFPMQYIKALSAAEGDTVILEHKAQAKQVLIRGGRVVSIIMEIVMQEKTDE